MCSQREELNRALLLFSLHSIVRYLIDTISAISSTSRNHFQKLCQRLLSAKTSTTTNSPAPAPAPASGAMNPTIVRELPAQFLYVVQRCVRKPEYANIVTMLWHSARESANKQGRS